MATTKKTTTEKEAAKPVAMTEKTKASADVKEVKETKTAPAAKTEEKAVKAEPVKTETKTEVKKPAAKKTTTAKKTTAKKKTTTKKAADKKVEEPAAAARIPSAVKNAAIYVQFAGNEHELEILKKRIVDKWCAEEGKKASSIKELNIYIKPEDNSAYYVINGQGSSIQLYEF